MRCWHGPMLTWAGKTNTPIIKSNYHNKEQNNIIISLEIPFIKRLIVLWLLVQKKSHRSLKERTNPSVKTLSVSIREISPCNLDPSNLY